LDIGMCETTISWMPWFVIKDKEDLECYVLGLQM